MQIQFDVEISNTITFITFMAQHQSRLAKVTPSHTSSIQCSAIQHDQEHKLVTYSVQLAKSQHPLHIMGYGTPTPTPAEDHTYHAQVHGHYSPCVHSSSLHTSNLPLYIFSYPTEWTRSSVPRSTHPPAN
jgi:hypothetical protein